MRMMSVLGSPRSRGNTAQVLAWVHEQWRKDGHALDEVWLPDHALAGCRECYACKSGKIRLCSVGDEGNALFERLIAADLVLLAAPVFCWNFPAQMKPFIDRMFCMTGSPDDEGHYSSIVEGKRFGLLMTCAGPLENNGDLLVRTYENIVDYLRVTDAGQLSVPGCTTPAALGGEVRQRAVDFAVRLGRSG